MIKYIAKVGGVPVAGLKLGIKDEAPEEILISGNPIDINRNYKIITSDYLAGGGDKMFFFNNPIKYEKLNLMMRDAIINYFTEMGKLNKELVVKYDNRIYYVAE
jgi:2',3'-cyclic-nucleotide 2'-phosphodiesterase (5'-nucleotidase family)